MFDVLSASDWPVPALAVAAYLLGGVSPGWWLARRATGVDLRSQGSGATGATNAGRVLGARGYAAVVVLDVAKGAVAVWAALLLAPGHPWAALAAPAVVAGHIWPVWLRFRGGRGAAPLLGACLALNAWIAAVAGVPGLAAWIILRKGFAARAAAFLAAAPAAWWLMPGTASRVSFALAWLLVLLAHRGHIGKILSR